MIWCLCLQNFETHERLVFRTKEEFLKWRKSDPDAVFLGHNFLSFDGPVLNRLWDAGIDLEESVIDTLVLSYLYDPALNDGHSLDAWGRRLGFPKGDFSDWSCYSPGMEEYCHNDVELTRRVYLALTKRMRTLGFSEMSCWIEHQIRIVIDEQQSNGFYFHKAQAETFRQHLRDRQKEIEESIHKLFPPKKVLIAEKREKYNQDGNLRKLYLTDIDRYIIEDNGHSYYDCYALEAFNLGSPKQRVERLLELGWKPDKFTKKGFPQVDEDALVRLSQALSEGTQKEAVDHLAEWLVIQGRASMLDTWMNNLGSDSRIHGRVITCGATTRRMTHSAPNTANIPSGAKAKYGKECRSFWGVEPGRELVLVGYDAAGLETAGLCHYLNNSSATKALLAAKPLDIHTVNSQRLTEALHRPIDREWGAKTSWYAWLYGAYQKKLGEIVKGSPEDGDTVIDTFFRNVPGLKRLIDDIKSEWRTRKGRLVTIDGGYVICPSESAALNYRVQSLGAILMKLTSIILRRKAKELGIPFKRVGDIHDEGQLETEKKYADQLGKLAVSCITEAGIQLKLNVTVTGDYKIGNSWEETH